MAESAAPLADEELAPDQPPRPPKAPPRSPLIKIPSIDRLPEQQPPAPSEEPEIIRIPPWLPPGMPPPVLPEEPPPLPPEDRTGD